MAVQAQQHSAQNLGFSLCASQGLMETGGGGGGGFNEFHLALQHQQQQRIMMMQQNQLRNQNLSFDHTQVLPSTNSTTLPSMAFTASLALEVERQRCEIERFVGLQNERLRSVLHEQKKQQLAIILKNLESKTLILLRQKDEDIAKAKKRTMELEDCLRRVEMENQAWQRVAQENEASVFALNNALEQVREKYCRFSSAAEDAESCCDFSNGLNKEDNEEKEERTREDVRDEERQMRKMVCKGCNSRSSCVLFLPCRHLCSCKYCETFLHCCPVCNSAKKATIEVLS